MKLTKIWSSEKAMKAATGLTLIEAKELLRDFSSERKNLKREPMGPGGRPESLDDKGVFTLVLIHYRHYLGFEFLGILFNVSSSSAKRLFDECDELLRSV